MEHLEKLERTGNYLWVLQEITAIHRTLANYNETLMGVLPDHEREKIEKAIKMDEETLKVLWDIKVKILEKFDNKTWKLFD